MYAKVVRVTETAGTYTCVLKILDKTMNTNEDFPEIPGVKQISHSRRVTLPLYSFYTEGAECSYLGGMRHDNSWRRLH